MCERLGTGRRTETFAARRRLAGERVAVKFLLESLSSHATPAVDNFVRELRAAGAIRHPNLAPVSDAGVFEDHVFLVMEYVDGETLGARLRRDGRLAECDARRIAGQLARALAVVHSHNSFHGNLTPENVMIRSSDASAALTDYVLDAAAGRCGVQLDRLREPGRPARGARDDLFDLGAILFHCLTGTPVQRQRHHKQPPGGEHCAQNMAETPAVHQDLEDVAVYLMSRPGGDTAEILEQTADFLLNTGNHSGRNNGKISTRHKAAIAIVPLVVFAIVVAAAAVLLAPRYWNKPAKPAARPAALKTKKPAAPPVEKASTEDARAERIRQSSWMYEQAGKERGPEDDDDAGTSERMPPVVGLPRADAVSRLEQKGLRVAVKQDSAPGCAPDTVTAQRPSPGAVVQGRAGAAIAVCAGGPETRVPNLVSLPLENAREIAEKQQLNLEIIERPSRPEGYGRVLAQTPAAGNDTRIQATITLTVGGPPPDTHDNIDSPR